MLMPVRSPFLSLIVCTRNRAQSLEQCLAAISELQPPSGTDFEFILIDNGSTDDTADVFDRARSMMPFPAYRIFEPAPGIGNAMNCGYLNSRGSIIAFTDDDCYPASDFPSAVLTAIDDPGIGVVTGRILLHDPSDLPITIEESTIRRRFRAGQYVRPGQFTGANLSFRRRALDSIGGFDPLFGPGSYMGSGADCDAGGRVCLAGWDGLYEPNIVVRHHHGRKEGDLSALRRRYAIGSGGYHMKLLIEEGRLLHFLHYLGSMPKRLMQEPSSLYWEALGATRYVKRPPRRSATWRNAAE
jgi:glycosyltransferase involved in cell wall biosynthesis